MKIKTITLIFVALLTLLSLTYINYKLTPKFTGFLKYPDNKTEQILSEAVSFNQVGKVEINLNIELASIYPDLYKIIPDNCLQKLIVNKQEISEGLPICDYENGKILALGKYLRPGKNELQALVENSGGPGAFKIAIATTDYSKITIISVATIIAIICLLTFLIQILKLDYTLTTIIISGILLRLLYFLATPPGIRSHDYLGHLEYINYVLEFFRIPPAQEGWEFFQPPLYYFLIAFILYPFKLFGFSADSLIDIAQLSSFFIASGAFTIGAWIGVQLWKKENEKFYLYAFTLILAVLPGLVFSASRISNDSLLHLLGFLFFGLLLKWVKSKDLKYWYWSIVVLSLAILTKSNAFAFVAIAFLTYLMEIKGKLKRKEFWGPVLKALVILAVLSSWLQVYRFAYEQEKHLVGNISGNSSGLISDISWKSFIYFNPFSVIEYPFNNAWVDDFGRNRLWEHLPKSAFSGEWNFGECAIKITRLIHLLNFILLPLAVAALFRDVLRLKNCHLWLTMILPLISIIGILSMSKIGGFQDFRYVQILAIPVTYYVLSAVQALPAYLKPLFQVCVQSFIILCFTLLYCIVY